MKQKHRRRQTERARLPSRGSVCDYDRRAAGLWGESAGIRCFIPMFLAQVCCALASLRHTALHLQSALEHRERETRCRRLQAGGRTAAPLTNTSHTAHTHLVINDCTVLPFLLYNFIFNSLRYLPLTCNYLRNLLIISE